MRTPSRAGIYSPHWPDEPRRLPRSTVFSPSPPPQDVQIIPPVPPVPLLRRPRPVIRPRRIPPPDFTGALRPREDPFPFEENGRLNRLNPAPPNPPIPQPPMRALPPPHGGPPRRAQGYGTNMGLGGALFAFNRQQELMAHNAERLREAHQAARVRLEDARRARYVQVEADGHFGFMAPFRRYIHHIWGGQGGHEEEDPPDYDDDLMEALAVSAAEAEGRATPMHVRWRFHPWGAERRAGPVGAPDFKPEFTHPGKPESGYLFDFAIAPEPIHIIDKPGSSSSSPAESNTILVCGKCLDPLAVNVVGSDETMKQSKVWALRCGHMFDGKCIDKIMKPAQIIDISNGDGPSSQQKTAEVRADGMDVSSSSLQLPSNSLSRENVSPTKGKGKGKRKASELDSDANVPPLFATHPLDPAMPGAFEQGPSSIRSRLRSRTSRGTPSVDSLDALEHASVRAEAGSIQEDPEEPSPRRSARGAAGRNLQVSIRPRVRPNPKGRGKGKGKAKGSAPVIEEEYEWVCPVAECGRKHFSLKIKGVWSMDPERGAIGVYV